MSTREMINALLDSVPEYKMGYVLAYLQGLTADEEADNAYCEQLYQDYLNDPDPDKHQTISLEELCKREGVYKRYRGRFLVFIWSLFLRLVFTDQETAAHIETLKPA